jgi:hypothetical protein
MTAMGLRSKRGKKLTLHVFLKMLRNVVYVAKMASKKWGARKGLHEPIVNERVLHNVQLVLSGKKPDRCPIPAKSRRCPSASIPALCRIGTPLTGGSSRSATGKTYDYYACYRCRAVKSLPASKEALKSTIRKKGF